jgi:hypothetical protein
VRWKYDTSLKPDEKAMSIILRCACWAFVSSR